MTATTATYHAITCDHPGCTTRTTPAAPSPGQAEADWWGAGGIHMMAGTWPRDTKHGTVLEHHPTRHYCADHIPEGVMP